MEEQLKKFLETGLSGGFLDIDDPSTADPGTFLNGPVRSQVEHPSPPILAPVQPNGHCGFESIYRADPPKH